MTGEIKNTLTLDASQFNSAIEKATVNVDKLDKELNALEKQSNKLDTSLAKNQQGLVGLNRRFDETQKEIGTTGKAFQEAQKSVGETTKNVGLLSSKLEKLTGTASKQKEAVSSLETLNKHYGNTLEGLNPVLERTRKTEEKLNKSRIKHAGEGSEKEKTRWLERRRILAAEEAANRNSLNSREQLYKQYEALERKLQTVQRNSTAKANTFATATTERGLKAYETHTQKANAATEQLEVIRKTKAEIEQSTSMLKSRNKELSTAVKLSDDALKRIKDERAIVREQTELARRRNSVEKERIQSVKDIEKAERGLADLKSRESKRAIADKRSEEKAATDALRTQERELQRLERLKERQHAQEMQRKKAEHQQLQQNYSDAAGLAAAVGTGAATVAGIHSAAEYQDTEARVRLLNLSGGDFETFKDKAWELAKSEKYLSRNDAMQTRLDALTAIGYNNEALIDKTIAAASRNAFVLKSAGFETGNMSDIVKNMYGFAEARQVMDSPDEVNKTFDIARRMSVASGGKLKMADIETVARNIGDLRQTMSAEGWVKLAAVMEQFKTAGGGNGGGGGVASVGTIFKMMSLYASGKTISNNAASSLLGADVLNEVYDPSQVTNFKNQEAANKAIMKAVKNSGFKDQKAMSKDPVLFFSNMRGQLLDFMMQDSEFKKFFGAGAEKHTYNKEGRMLNSKGQMVERREQDDVENQAFKTMFAQAGYSNKAIDGYLLMMNRAFIERSNHAAETAMGSQSDIEAMQSLNANWNTNIIELKASLKDLAVTFEPLLKTLTAVPKAISDTTRAFSEFAGNNPALGTIALLTSGFALVGLAVKGLFGPLGALGRLLGASGVAGSAASAASKVGMVSAVLTALGVTSSKTSADVKGVGDKAKIAGDDLAAMGGKAEQGATKAAKSASKFGTITTAVRGVAGSSMRILGLLFNWAGWAVLAGMFGWAVGKWISDLQIGGLTIGEHFQNLLNGISNAWHDTFLGISENLQKFFNWLGVSNDKALKDIQKTRAESLKMHDDLRILSADEKIQKSADTRDNAAQIVKDKYWASKQKSSNPADREEWMKYARYHNIANTQSTADKVALRNGTLKEPEMQGSAAKTLEQLNKRHEARVAEIKGVPKGKEPEQITHPTTFTAGSNPAANIKPGVAGGGSVKTPKESGSGREFENKFQASLAGLLAKQVELSIQDEAVYNKEAPNYQALGRNDFAKQWLSGAFDDGRDPSKRKFTNVAYDKARGHKATDINWSKVDPQTGKSAQDWVDEYEKLKRLEDEHKAVQFAVTKSANVHEKYLDSLEDAAMGMDTQSSALSALIREYARFEAKNPMALQNSTYLAEKQIAIAEQTSADYLIKAKSAKEFNKENAFANVDNEHARNKYSIDQKYKKELDPYLLAQKSLNDQIAAFEMMATRSKEQERVYKDLIDARAQFESDFTEFQRIQEEKRRRESLSTYDQQMLKLRDYETAYRNLISDIGTGTMNGIVEKYLAGSKDFSFSEMFSNLAMNGAKSAFGNLWSKASEKLIGMDGKSDLYSVGRSILKGEGIEGGGIIGGWLNKVRGGATSGLDADGVTATGLLTPMQALGNMFDTMKAKLALFGNSTDEASTGMFSLARDAISQAISALASWVTSLFTAKTAQDTSTGLSAVKGLFSGTEADGNFATSIAKGLFGAENVGAIDPINGNGLFLDQIIGSANPLTAGEESGLFTGLFDTFENGFVDMFSDTGSTGLFASLKDGMGGLFNGLFNGIGGAGASAGGNWVSSLVGIASSFFANGGTFGTAQAFASGGAFTNGIYDSPTLFKFANGGSFKQGVMGEAGPEAVMPLQRDGSGRLGVAVNGSSNATPNVTISINVTNNTDGTTSAQTSGDTQSDWMTMTNRVKAIVQEEIVKQKRPGGMLR